MNQDNKEIEIIETSESLPSVKLQRQVTDNGLGEYEKKELSKKMSKKEIIALFEENLNATKNEVIKETFSRDGDGSSIKEIIYKRVPDYRVRAITLKQLTDFRLIENINEKKKKGYFAEVVKSLIGSKEEEDEEEDE